MTRAKQPHPAAAPRKSAPNTAVRDKATMAALDQQLDNQMNANLAKAFDDFNGNSLPKHSELLKPMKLSIAPQTNKYSC
jgi:hypothetical protein